MGTLAAILADVADHLGLERDELLERLLRRKRSGSGLRRDRRAQAGQVFHVPSELDSS